MKGLRIAYFFVSILGLGIIIGLGEQLQHERQVNAMLRDRVHGLPIVAGSGMCYEAPMASMTTGSITQSAGVNVAGVAGSVTVSPCGCDADIPNQKKAQP